MAILILGTDDHALHVREQLQRLGEDVELLDSRWFPSQMTIECDPRSGCGKLCLPKGRAMDCRDVSAVYWRNYHGVGAVPLPDPEQSYIAENDSRGLFESLLIGLPCRWVNGWNAFQLHQTKPVQLARVAALGVPVPATLLTNDPEAVREFVSRHPQAIYKPVQGGAHADHVRPQHLQPRHLANLAVAPVTLQEEISGANIRVFVAGERVLGCEIRAATLDFRDDPNAELLPCELPDSTAQASREIARTLDLLWTGIDFRRTPDGVHVFLEANPSPMFLGFEARTGLPLTESLIALLRA